MFRKKHNFFVFFQVALGRPICEIARNVVCNLRLSLLTAEELSKIETENIKEHLIPVSFISFISF